MLNYSYQTNLIALCPTTYDAMSIDHEVHGIAGHVGYSDAQKLFRLVYVPQPDVLL